MQGTKQFAQDIKAYLDGRAATDGLFKEKYEATTRSIDDVVTYILNQVKASGCNGFSDEEIYSMAVHVIDEPTIDIGEKVACQVVVNHQIILTEEEKARARQDAMRTYQTEQLNKLRGQSKPRAKAGNEEQSPSLFDFAV